MSNKDILTHSCRQDGCLGCSGGFCGERVPIFFGLKNEDYQKIASLIVHKSYDKGELIFSEGESFAYMAIIRKGLIKTFKYTIEGREQIIGIFEEGDFIGEMNLLRGTPSNVHCSALQKTELCLIPKERFQQLIKDHPDIMFHILEELAGRVGQLESLVQQLGTQNADSRLTVLLVQLSERYGEVNTDGVEVELPLSREGLANYIGVTRETVSRKLSQLRDDGVIEIVGNRKILIKDLDELKLRT